jgi:serine/threonine-protein kinase RsbW
MGTQGVQQRVPATADAVARIRNAARTYAAERCGVDGELQSSIALAVSEAASNVVLHAYREGDGEIEFEADVEGDALTVWVRDHGVGVGEPSPNKGLGTGMRIMQGLADVNVDSNGDGTEVELRFQLPACQPG